MDKFKKFFARKDVVFTLQRYGIDALGAITLMDWIGMARICFILPAVLSTVFCEILRKWGWIKENDLKLDL